MVTQKTLHLTLKKCWFDLILSGSKTQEYRDLSDYWLARLLFKIEIPQGGYWNAEKDIRKGDYEGKGWKSFTGGAPVFEDFGVIIFKNGYSKTAPMMKVKFNGIHIGRGLPAFGAPHDRDVFIIELGEIIEKTNY